MIIKRKPQFKRTDWNKKPRFSARAKKIRWKNPRGIDSKIKQGRKGHGAVPSVGYRSPKATRGKINGMNPIRINRPLDLDNFQKGDIAIVSAKLGGKKKIDLANKALKLKINFLNFNPEQFLKDVKKRAEEKKAAKKPEKKVEEKKAAEKKEEKKAPEKAKEASK